MSTAPPASAVNSRPSRSASGMNGCTVALASVAARLTAKGTNSPRSARTTCSAMVCPALSCASTVDAPRCGVTTTESSSNSGDSVVGSCGEHVERGAGDPALAHRVGERGLVDDAAAGGVDDAQRRLGVRQQLGGDQAERVGRLGQVDGEEVGPARRAPRPSARGRRPAGGPGRRSRRGRTRASCMPNARARCATSTPTRPSPTMPSVLPCSSTPSQRVRFH